MKITGEILTSTPLALLIRARGRKTWVPRAAIRRLERRGEVVTLHLPGWLGARKFSCQNAKSARDRK